MKDGKVISWVALGIMVCIALAVCCFIMAIVEGARWYVWACLLGCTWSFWHECQEIIRHVWAGNIDWKNKAGSKSKALLILPLIIGLYSAPAAAQIHQAGQTTLEFSGGLVDGFKLPGRDNFGTFGGLAYSKYKSINTYWKAGVHLNQKFYAYDKTFVPVSQWLVEGTYFTRVMGLINRSWVVNAGAGVAGGYESINQDGSDIKGATIMNRSEWVVGPTLAIEGEYILTGRTILIARVQEYYLFRSNIIPTRFNVGVGVKFILDTDSSYK